MILYQRDIKLGNIFYVCRSTFKLGGFHLSIPLNYEKDDSKDPIGTAPYIAPEIWLRREYSKASDIYAFAICVYEVLTEELVYRDKSDTEIMYLVTV